MKKLQLPFLIFLSLQVFGQSVETAANGLYYDPTTGTTPRVVGLGGTLTQNTTIDLGAAYSFGLKKGSDNYFNISNNGNVGIGTMYPIHKLDVNGAAGFSGNLAIGPNVWSTASQGMFISPVLGGPIQDVIRISCYSNSVGSSLFGTRIQLGASESVNNLTGILLLTHGVLPGFSVNNTTGLRINNNAAGIVSNAQLVVGEASNANNVNILVGATIIPSGSYSIYNISQDKNYFEGALGIGNANPNSNAKLDVNGNIYCNSKIYIGTPDANTQTNITNYSLAVNGNAIFNKVKVKSYGSWPDYVFEDDYKLMPLHQVASFIKRHKHLPEVPAATEVEKEGLDVGDTQAILLKKIEELTLYVIDLDKKVAELAKENAELRKQQ